MTALRVWFLLRSVLRWRVENTSPARGALAKLISSPARGRSENCLTMDLLNRPPDHADAEEKKLQQPTKHTKTLICRVLLWAIRVFKVQGPASVISLSHYSITVCPPSLNKSHGPNMIPTSIPGANQIMYQRLDSASPASTCWHHSHPTPALSPS